MTDRTLGRSSAVTYNLNNSVSKFQTNAMHVKGEFVGEIYSERRVMLWMSCACVLCEGNHWALNELSEYHLAWPVVQLAGHTRYKCVGCVHVWNRTFPRKETFHCWISSVLSQGLSDFRWSELCLDTNDFSGTCLQLDENPFPEDHRNGSKKRTNNLRAKIAGKCGHLCTQTSNTVQCNTKSNEEQSCARIMECDSVSVLSFDIRLPVKYGIVQPV